VASCALLIAIGINELGMRFGASVALSEQAVRVVMTVVLKVPKLV
jgi:hypothetical protein